MVEALDVLREGGPRRIGFGVSQESAWDVGLACGGELELLIEDVTPHREILAQMADLQSSQASFCTITDMAVGVKTLVTREQYLDTPMFSGSFTSRGINWEGRDVFLHFFAPPLKLIIIGAVHLAKPLSQIARMAGYEVLIIDPREAFYTSDHFTDFKVITQWPDEALAQIAVHDQTAIVTLTHDPKLDDPALTAALDSPAFYIGALGSRKTHAQRLERLGLQGIPMDKLKKIHGPVGLSIGARKPTEIAVSILSEIIDQKRKHS